MVGVWDSRPAKIALTSATEIGLGASWDMREISQLGVNLSIQPTLMDSVALSMVETRLRTSLWILYGRGYKEVFVEGIGLERRTKASIKLLVDEKAVTALCNVSQKIWNMPESHAAQPLDYLSQYP